MAYQYKRRRPSILRNFWIYRRLIGSAVLLGLMLWFIWANDAPVSVAFPFRLGKLDSSLGVVILLSALVGSLVTILVMTVVMATKKFRGVQSTPPLEAHEETHEERPPSDYAAKTTEGFTDARWSN